MSDKKFWKHSTQGDFSFRKVHVIQYPKGDFLKLKARVNYSDGESDFQDSCEFTVGIDLHTNNVTWEMAMKGVNK